MIRWFYIYLFIPFALQAKIHAIIAIDTLSENVEIAMEYNVMRWRYFLKDLERSSGIEVNDVYFTGAQLTWSHVQDYISALSVEADDTILFFSSTHGTRLLSKELPWPDLHWSTEEGIVDSMHIVDILREKNGRLLVVITEACNTYRPIYESSQHTLSLACKSPREQKKENLQKLFLETKGEIIVTSAAPGEFSWVYVPSRGGIFTECFFQSFREMVYEGSGAVDWATLLETTAQKVVEDCGGRDLQHPIYQINP